MPPDDAHDRGQAEAPARELGGEEGLEDAGHGFGIHAAARIGYLQVDVGARDDVLAHEHRPNHGRIEVLGPGGQGDEPRSPVDGFRGIDDEVHDHLLDLGRVRRDGGQPPAEVQLEDHRLGQAHLQEVHHLLHLGRQV